MIVFGTCSSVQVEHRSVAWLDAHRTARILAYSNRKRAGGHDDISQLICLHFPPHSPSTFHRTVVHTVHPPTASSCVTRKRKIDNPRLVALVRSERTNGHGTRQPRREAQRSLVLAFTSLCVGGGSGWGGGLCGGGTVFNAR